VQHSNLKLLQCHIAHHIFKGKCRLPCRLTPYNFVEWPTSGENEEKRQQRAGTGRAKGEENSARSKSGDLKGGKGRERENDPKTLSRLAFLGRGATISG